MIIGRILSSAFYSTVVGVENNFLLIKKYFVSLHSKIQLYGERNICADTTAESREMAS